MGVRPGDRPHAVVRSGRAVVAAEVATQQRGDDDACVFLNEQGKCRIHAKFGGPAKPLACQVYPFTLNPAGDHWQVGIRFACPSVT